MFLLMSYGGVLAAFPKLNSGFSAMHEPSYKERAHVKKPRPEGRDFDAHGKKDGIIGAKLRREPILAK